VTKGEVVSELTGARLEGDMEFTDTLGGEEVTLRPKKKSALLIKLMVVDPNDELKNISYMRAQLEALEDALDSGHRKTRTRPGHGQESIEGCQACRMYDRLDDNDDSLEIEECMALASKLQGLVSDRPTGRPSA
jgi:hypothetical protein